MTQNRRLVFLLLLSFFSFTFSYAQKDPASSLVPPVSDSIRIDSWLVKSKSFYNLLFQTREKKLNTGAVGEIYTPELQKTASASFGGLLTGRMAGLYATQSSGEPGNDDVSLLLRGQAPLVMV
ncbi:MAG TPA: hypothetical protein VLD19_06735, partial [Chitinophagaceae bacterium]|nr:hypothetical protein [Chitinophagaceae bacterium]